MAGPTSSGLIAPTSAVAGYFRDRCRFGSAAATCISTPVMRLPACDRSSAAPASRRARSARNSPSESGQRPQPRSAAAAGLDLNLEKLGLGFVGHKAIEEYRSCRTSAAG
jgi:hypothetical protein